MRGDQFLGERLERRGIDVSDCYFQSEPDKQPPIESAHLSSSPDRMGVRNDADGWRNP